MLTDICIYAALLAGGYGIGLELGYPLPGMLAVAVLLYLWHIRYLHRLLAHLREDRQPAEMLFGTWNEVGARISRLQAKNCRDNQSGTLQSFRASMTSLPFGIVQTDAKNRIEWFNDRAMQMAGLAPRDTGINITHLLREPDFAAALRGNGQTAMLSLNDRRLMVHVSRFQDKQLVIIQDVSRLHHLETVRRELLSNMSHELRSPLTVVKGYAEILHEELAHHSEETDEAIGEIMRQSDQMEHIIDDAMSLERLEDAPLTGKELAPIDVDNLVNQVCAGVKALFAEKQCILEKQIESDARLYGSFFEIRSAFFNLVHNALRYSPSQNRVTMRWSSDDMYGYLSVSDEGHGIAPEHIPHLTERMYRVDAGRSHAMGGTGLGLAIVKHVLRRHNAELDIQSVVGEGSTFVCKFPADCLLSPDAKTDATEDLARKFHQER